MLRGKVARHCAICVLALFGALSTSAIAAPLLTEQLPKGKTLWYTNGAVPSQYYPAKFDLAMPSDLTLDTSIPVLKSTVAGELSSTVETRIYKDADGYLTFDYVIKRDGGNAFVVGTSLGGAGWKDVQILAAGIGELGASGTGDPESEWTNGAPYYISRDPALGTPYWRFRAPGFAAVDNFESVPVGTVIGAASGVDDTSAHIWFRTNATDYHQDYMGMIDSGAVGRAEIYVPSPVPEPSTLLIALAAGLLSLRRRTA